MASAKAKMKSKITNVYIVNVEGTQLKKGFFGRKLIIRGTARILLFGGERHDFEFEYAGRPAEHPDKIDKYLLKQATHVMIQHDKSSRKIHTLQKYIDRCMS